MATREHQKKRQMAAFKSNPLGRWPRVATEENALPTEAHNLTDLGCLLTRSYFESVFAPTSLHRVGVPVGPCIGLDRLGIQKNIRQKN